MVECGPTTSIRSVGRPSRCTRTRARLSGTRSPVSLFCSRVANALACANGVGVASQRPTRLGITDPLCLRDALAYATGVVSRVNVRHCRRRRGAGTSGAMRMRARLSGARGLVSLFCSRVANALAFAFAARGARGRAVRMAMMGLGGAGVDACAFRSTRAANTWVLVSNAKCP